MTPSEFWGETSKFGQKENMEKILAYLYMMVVKAKEKGIPFTKEYLRSLGANIKYFKGVTTWFKRINDYGASLGLDVQHYIISSGVKDIIEGTDIAKEFKAIYACEYMFDKNGDVVWPKIAINYTMKTQYVFRISKGIDRLDDDDIVNSKVSEKDRRVLYRNMIYLGDGITDVPCMKLVKQYGGQSIAIYQANKFHKVQKLIDEGRVNYVCPSDYRDGSELDSIVKLIIQRMALTNELESIRIEQELERKTPTLVPAEIE
jgi:2-hydroxy-3-keto-5-methylthiopentenyl-1-phosphate phosphatase